MKTSRSFTYSGHDNRRMLKIGDRTGSWISPDVIHPTIWFAGTNTIAPNDAEKLYPYTSRVTRTDPYKSFLHVQGHY